MSGRESLWRRTAGLYLSSAPDAGDSGAAAELPADMGATKHDVVLLGEALDLVTLSQGYKTPALPPLLRALIRDIKVLRTAVEGAATPEAEAAASETPAEASATDDAAEAAAAPAAEETEKSAAAEEAGDEARRSALETRVAATDQKLAALTGAVGQLVDLLQRRGPAAGAVDRRAAPRVSGQNAKIYVHDRGYDVVNWNKNGFLIRIGEADRFSRSGFDCHFVLELPDESVEFQSRAVPVRIERATLAAEFRGLDEASEEKLTQVIEQLIGAESD
ncbi:MAG: hypothetical protein MJE12_23270 [Alphaproteobacteria bacterium]|nr:hypothetical protein [Alphaproteobacteria bacterium]